MKKVAVVALIVMASVNGTWQTPIDDLLMLA